MPPIIIAVVANPVVQSFAISAGSAIVSTVAGFYTQRGLNKIHRIKAANASRPVSRKRMGQH
jgi:hypothetical protein